MSNILRHLRGCLSLFLISMIAGLGGCQPSCQRDAAAPEDVTEKNLHLTKDIAAVVNSTKLNTADLDGLHTRAIQQFKRTGRPVDDELDKKMRGSILRKMIDDELIAQRAEKEGIKVDRFERVEALEKYKERMGGQKGFDAYLTRQQLTEEQIQKTVLAELQREKIVQKLSSVDEPSEAEVNRYYQSNQKLFTLPEMVHARHILLKLSEADPKEKADLVLKKAQDILKEAHGGASFESLVQKYSEGPSVKQNGDLGFFPRGRMNKAFEDAAFGAQLKTAVGPVKTEFGYHLIYVEEKTPSKAAPLEDVHARIVESLKRNHRGMKAEELLADLRKSAKITINDYSMTLDDYLDHRKAEKVAEAAPAASDGN